MKARILWVEGRWTADPTFAPTLTKKGYEVETVTTGKQALASADESIHDLIVVDAASMRTSGKRICRALRDQVNGMPIVLISDPERSVTEEDAGATVVLTLPFTSRKLVNRVVRLLPGDEGRMVEAGPIKLDLEKNRVQCKRKKSRLTPRLVSILHMLMRTPGEVVPRDKLFKKVWKTEYLGDTRTLDVHISWLRQALGDNSRKPKYLKTIRGVGYRLDVTD